MELRTKYMGLELRNPLVAAASSLTNGVDKVRAMADAGVGAIVLPSLYAELVREQDLEDTMQAEVHAESFAEAPTFLPSAGAAESDGATAYLRMVEDAANTVDVPVIASLNAGATGEWVAMARRIASAGAAALELNVYSVAADPTTPAIEIEDLYAELVAEVKADLAIPVAVKLLPYFSSLGNLLLRLEDAGADGLVLFNRWQQPDIDIERMEAVPMATLSAPADLRLPLTWVALLRNRLECSIAANSGLDQPEDMVKLLLAGADAVQTASALIRNGVPYVGKILEGLTEWMSRHNYETIADFRGKLAAAGVEDAREAQRSAFVTAMRTANRGSASLA